MIKNISSFFGVFLFFLLLLVFKLVIKKEDIAKPIIKKNNDINITDKVISIANSYKGVPYRQGGIKRSGMDCSGLVQTSFKQVELKLPRSSKAMSTVGHLVKRNEIKIGDLLFFNIDRLKGNINHVGLVTSIYNEEIFFIHSTTSRGIITTSLEEEYWKETFVKAKRVL